LQAFLYHAPESLDQALELVAEHTDNAVLLAGGTDILVQLRENLRQADHVVDVKKIAELQRLEKGADEELVLGAAVTCSRLLGNDATAEYSALRDAATIIGGWQIQSRATIGGNVCNSSPAADSTPALIALGSVVECIVGGQAQTIPVGQFCTAPGKNILNGNGLLVSFRLPPIPPRSGSAYQRFIPRYEMDIATASAASFLTFNEAEQVISARVALGAVAATPLAAETIAETLVGEVWSESLVENAARLAGDLAQPIDDMRGTIEFRRHLAYVLTKRTLQTAARRARGEVISHHPH